LGYNTDRLPDFLVPEREYRIPSVGKKGIKQVHISTFKTDGTYLYHDHATGASGAFNPENRKSKAPSADELAEYRRKAEWAKQKELQLKQQKAMPKERVKPSKFGRDPRRVASIRTCRVTPRQPG
jgi:hypothetical protein